MVVEDELRILLPFLDYLADKVKIILDGVCIVPEAHVPFHEKIIDQFVVDGMAMSDFLQGLF